ncbi:MAG: hypothetical protein QF839_01225 [Candidatus Poseidoniaceae archaeon]|jgi:flagellin FlaB|nr:hypothetical protein [Candidatus Poseidoniaceae archaeon]
MNNERKETRDNAAAIGIGAMIVFIALILVAAVAAAVIIQTAEKLQQNAQSAGDDTQEQMSTKVVLLSTVIWDMTGGTETIFSTFELAAGSNPVVPADVSFTVVCDDGAGGTAFAAGNFGGAEDHTGDGTGGALASLDPGTTYVVQMDISNCAPTANTGNILVLSVVGGGQTYEELQYGSDPSVGDVVV